MSPQQVKPHLVVVLAYDGLCTFEFACAVEVFALRRPELGVAWYDFAVCNVDGGPLQAAGGVTVQVPPSRGLLARADTIVVPGWRGIDSPVPAALLRQLRAAQARGARLCSICSGVFVLAAAGVLNGLSATTHWRYAQALAERYPAIAVKPDALYIDQGQIVTAAGSAAGLDMLLHLVRRDHGGRVANLVAQRLVIAPHREGGQAQFVPRPMLPDDRGRVPALMAWMRGHLQQAHTLASLARRAAMSPRTLHRQFTQAAGLPPIDWLQRERVAFARELLERKNRRPHQPFAIARVAELAGFGSEESLRRHFRRHVGMSPTAYRTSFAHAAATRG
jgi:AraC family transcriptional regulator, transcriptional activator FtrA